MCAFHNYFLSLLRNYNHKQMKRILIVGAGGQIGSELTVYLRNIYGGSNVVATDMRECKSLGEDGPFEVLNALDATAMASVVARYHVDTIFNLVALLSAVGERNPQMAWNVNMGALNNSLEVARQHHCALFTPSSIGAFGPTSPKDKTPQDTIPAPDNTMRAPKSAPCKNDFFDLILFFLFQTNCPATLPRNNSADWSAHHLRSPGNGDAVP